MNSNSEMLSELLFLWGCNNTLEDPFYISSNLNGSSPFENYTLSTESNTQQQLFTYNNDNTFYDLFPQENHHFIINNTTEPSTRLLLHQESFHNNHIPTLEPFKENTPPSVEVQKKNNSNKRKRPSTEDEQKTKQGKKKLKKKKKKVDVDPNAPPKAKRITGLNRPLLLSISLQTIMEGATELSRPEIVKRLWNYIKSNQLQDPADRRFILCDEKLKSIFQKDRVNSFGMNRDLSAHLTKKEESSTNTCHSEERMTKNYDIALSPKGINTNNQQNSHLVEDFSPVQTAETPDIMTPSDSELFLQKWSSSF